MRVFIACLCLWFLLPSWTIAQGRVKRVVQDSAVAQLFADTTTLLWHRFYRGAMNDVHVVEFSLASDGRICRGYLRYPQSETRILLKGVINGDRLELAEYDDSNAVCGHWSGTIREISLLAEWRSNDQVRGAYAEASVYPYPLKTTALSNTRPAFFRYSGKWHGNDVALVLAQTFGKQINGSISFGAEDHVYRLQGRLESDSLLFLLARDTQGSKNIRLDGVFRPEKPLFLRWSSTGERRDIHLTSLQSFPVASDTWADFHASREVMYPVSNCAECNRWFENKIDSWSRQVDQQKTVASAGRNAIQAAGWVEISTWDDAWFSGLLFLHAPGEDYPKGHAFCFDLSKNKVVEIKDVFKQDADWRAFIESHLNATVKLWTKNGQSDNWMKADGLPLMIITRDGLELSTTFHPVYGRKRMVIVYAALKPFVKNKKVYKRLLAE